MLILDKPKLEENIFYIPSDKEYHPCASDIDADPIIQWSGNYHARFKIGGFVGQVDFYICNGRRCRGWWQVTYATGKTRLFPKIDKCLKSITENFMNTQKPQSLFIYGDDAKRNNWNSQNYCFYNVPKEYRFFKIINHSIWKKNVEGVIGVGWLNPLDADIPNDEFNYPEDRIEF